MGPWRTGSDKVVDRARSPKAHNMAIAHAPQVPEHPIPGRKKTSKTEKSSKEGKLKTCNSKDMTGSPPRADIQACRNSDDAAIFKNPLGIMKGREMTINLTDTSTLFACYNPRKIAIPLEAAAKKELDAQVAQGIIKSNQHATLWVSQETPYRFQFGEIPFLQRTMPGLILKYYIGGFL